MALDEATKQRIDDLVKNNRVMLFMKGSKSFPQCGFSSAVISILKETGVKFETTNVLQDAGVREGIKAYSDWPTIPQLYVDGQFVGGCDIVREMHASGELQALLGVAAPEIKAPAITVTEAAAKAFLDAAEPGDDMLRLEVDERFTIDLFFGPRAAGDFEVKSNGVTLLVDRATAQRTDGTVIDYVDGPQGKAFKVDNPNAPASVKQIGPVELQKLLAGSDPVTLIDVRTEGERATAHIEGSLLLSTPEAKQKLESIDKNAIVVFQCHHGGRSQAAAESFLGQGFKRVYNLAGGIDAWSRDVDPKVPRY
jgi:monothiol glutaredoxin